MPHPLPRLAGRLTRLPNGLPSAPLLHGQLPRKFESQFEHQITPMVITVGQPVLMESQALPRDTSLWNSGAEAALNRGNPDHIPQHKLPGMKQNVTVQINPIHLKIGMSGIAD